MKGLKQVSMSLNIVLEIFKLVEMLSGLDIGK